MKTRIFLIAVTVLMLSAFSNLSAQKASSDVYNISKHQQVLISYDAKDMVTVEYLNALSDGPWKMKVRIYSDSGQLLYTRVLRKKGNARVGYDISELPTGNYTIELYNKRDLICSKAISKQESYVNTEQGLEADITKFHQVEICSKSNDMVHLEYIDIFGEGRRKMEVRIYEESGELLYSKHLDKVGDVKLDFDISKLPSGNYTFELLKNGGLVYEDVIVKETPKAIAKNGANLIAKENSHK
jgi:hypothetical protein